MGGGDRHRDIYLVYMRVVCCTVTTHRRQITLFLRGLAISGLFILFRCTAESQLQLNEGGGASQKLFAEGQERVQINCTNLGRFGAVKYTLERYQSPTRESSVPGETL